MGKLSRATFLQMGAHTANNWTTFPSSPVFVEAHHGFEVVDAYEQVERDYAQSTSIAGGLSSLNGRQSAALNNLRLPVHGLSTAAGNGASSSGQLTTIVDHLLNMLMGADATDYEGDLAHASAPGDENSVIGAAAWTDLSAGGLVGVTGDDSGLLHVRFVESVSGGDTLNVAPDITDRLDANETKVGDGSTVYGMRTWTMTESNGNRTHVGADVEGQDWRRRLYGLSGNMALEFPAGGSLTLSGSLVGSSWEDSAEASPSYSAATKGQEVRCVEMPLYIDGSLYMASELALDFGTVWEPRASDGAAQGVFGQVCVRQIPVLTGLLHSGALTAPLEVTDSVLETWKGTQTAQKTSRKVLVQSGRTAGALFGAYMPSAEVNGQRVVVGGQDMIRFTAIARRSSTRAPLYIGIG